ELLDPGAHNINLVTPTHDLPQILPTFGDLPVPVVMNCGGYESVETIESLRGRVQIFLPDFKYAIGEVAERYSFAPDYPERALEAIEAMIDVAGPPVFDEEGILQSGVIVRHMVLPNETKNSLRVIDALEGLPKGQFLFSLMSQYTPCGRAAEYPRIARPLRESEYNRVLRRLEASDLLTNGYSQAMESADQAYIPPFDLEGVLEK
ncbi:MAG: radical SAM protein, partial [Clostridia bacterium]|nr:radical SAM protein [Clostridia bacterium]